MTGTEYDAIVVGARCAGSPTAMLLARKGYRVLLVDRATFPSDTMSTHLVQPTGIAALGRWGLLDALVATGCPPVHTFTFDFGPFVLTGAPGTPQAPTAYCPRRFVLDKILLDAAAAAGAEVREGFTVAEILVEDGRVVGVRGHGPGGGPVTERAKVVIGADGLRSLVAETVESPRYHETPPLLCGYYAYWSGLPMDGRFANHILPGSGFAAADTHEGLTLVVGGWPYAEFAANKTDVEGNYLRTLRRHPGFAERLRDATLETRVVGMPVPNYFRKPFGPGWALVGDAGYNKDYITAQGISDAFRSAELCSTALDEAFSGARSFTDAMADYQSARDVHALPMFEFTTQLASLEPPPPELQALLGAMVGNQDAMDGFARVNSGVTSPAEFFSQENVGRILAAGGGGS
jgi:flavin-dependent dehydrogenase